MVNWEKKIWVGVAIQSPPKEVWNSSLCICETHCSIAEKWAFWAICRHRHSQDTWWLTELLTNTNKPPFWRVFLWILYIYTQKSAGYGESLFRECNATVLFLYFFSLFFFFCCWAAYPAHIGRYLSYQTMESCFFIFLFFLLLMHKTRQWNNCPLG